MDGVALFLKKFCYDWSGTTTKIEPLLFWCLILKDGLDNGCDKLLVSFVVDVVIVVFVARFFLLGSEMVFWIELNGFAGGAAGIVLILFMMKRSYKSFTKVAADVHFFFMIVYSF